MARARNRVHGARAAPGQRACGHWAERDWQDVSGGKVDPTRPYLLQSCRAGSRSISSSTTGPSRRRSRSRSCSTMARTSQPRLTGGFSDDRATGPQLVHIATDGETYGHHHRHGEMALAYALDTSRPRSWLRSPTTASFWRSSPPHWEVRDFREYLLELHSRRRALAHRIAAATPADAGLEPGVAQAVARSARLAAGCDQSAVLKRSGATLLRDPWAARDAYISVILDRSPEARERFGQEHFSHPLDRRRTGDGSGS